MSAPGAVPFFEMFPALDDGGLISESFKEAVVLDASVDSSRRTMKINLSLKEPTAPVVIRQAESAVQAEYSLSGVEIRPVYQTKMQSSGKNGAAKQSSGTVLMGRAIKDDPIPIEEITLDSGKVTIRGDVFNVTSREIQRRGAYVLSFDMTDNTNSIRVSKFITDADMKEAAQRIKNGMYVTVTGVVGYNRYDSDIVIDPQSIVRSEKAVRMDKADQKRVELHLHTQMSAMDATTDVKQAIKRAIEWGHSAIAITDHGVCHSFPDAMNAAGDKIKVLYGLEGYYVNDVDDRPAVIGDINGPLSDEVAVFDIDD